MPKPPTVVIRATPRGLASLSVAHDPGCQADALALLGALLPALRAVDHHAKTYATARRSDSPEAGAAAQATGAR